MHALTLTADLSGVTDLTPVDTADSPYYYSFRVQCTSCREIHPNWVGVSQHDSNEQSGSRGEAHFVWRCKSCKREHSAVIKGGPFAYTQSSPPKRQKVLDIDCRGLEFLEFRADGDWAAKGLESGTKFTGIDLGEGDWFDYDEKAGEEVSVKDFVWEVRRNA